MKSAFEFVCKIVGFCMVVYILGLVQNPTMRPDLRPAVRAIGAYISGLYPEEHVRTVEEIDPAKGLLRLVHELPQTPRS